MKFFSPGNYPGWGSGLFLLASAISMAGHAAPRQQDGHADAASSIDVTLTRPAMAVVAPPVHVAVDTDVSDLCDGELVSFSPSGRFVASHSAFRGDVTIFETDCVLRGNACSGWALSSISAMNAVSWRTDDTAVLTLHDGVAQNFDPHLGLLQTDGRAATNGFPNEATAYGLFTASTRRWDADIPERLSRYRVLGVWFAETANSYALIDPADHRVMLVLDRDSAPVETGLSARWSSGWAPVNGDDGAAYLVGSGVLRRRADTGSFPDALPDLYQPRPIIDASTGRLTAAYSDDRISTLGGVLWSKAFTREPGSGLSYIEGAAYASSAQTYAVKSVNLDGSRQFVLSRGQVAYHRIDCGVRRGRNAFRNSRRPAPEPVVLAPLPVIVENWGVPARPLMVRRRGDGRTNRPIVVFWRGGPGNTFADGGASFEQTWIDRGFEVISIDGSGSQGIEQGQRLREDGLEAVLEDAEIVARHLASPAFSGSRIVVHGGSFGAIGAAETALRLSLLQPDKAPPDLLLIAPWLRHRETRDYNAPSGRERLNEDFRSKSEAAAFGSVEDYARKMAEWRAGFKYKGRTLALFAQGDSMVLAEDMWPSASSNPVVSVRIIPGVDHRFIAASAETDSAINAWIDKP